MRILRYLTALLPFSLLAVKVMTDFHEFVSARASQILSSPNGLLIMPVSLFIKGGFHYFQEGFSLSGKPISAETWIYAVSPHLATILIFQITAIFIYFYSRTERLQRSFFIFTFAVSFYFLFFLDFISGNHFSGFFYFVALFINIPFLYLFQALYGRRLNNWVIFILSLAAAAFFYLFYPWHMESEKTYILLIGIWHAVSAAWCIGIMVSDVRKPEKNSPVENRLVRAVLAALALISLALPALSFITASFISVEISISKNALFFLPALFPMALFILSVKFGIMRFEIPVYGWIIKLLYFVFFSFLYWFSIGYHISQIHYYDDKLVWHILAAVAFLFVLDPIRTLFYLYVNRFFMNRKLIFRDYLSQAMRSVSNPRQIVAFLETFSDAIRKGVGSSMVKVIFSDDTFSRWKIQHPDIIYLKGDDFLWTQMEILGRARPYPAYTVSSLGRVRELLEENNAFLIMGLQRYRVAVLVSDKLSREPFLSEDIIFIRSLLRISEPLLENYRFLIANIHLRRQEKELELAARIQRRIIPTGISKSGVEFVSYSQASEQVTGDYIDFLEISPGNYCIFLGDVSGHGLGSAYIMAVIRSFIRGSMIGRGMDLETVFRNLNLYLADEYKGSDFMTLFGLQLHFEGVQNRNAVINYLNAGQHSAVIFRNRSKTVTKLEKSQRVLGVISTDYRIETWRSDEPFRLYLYSDGAFEIFDDGGKMLGENKLMEWIRKSVHLSAAEQIEFLKKRIRRKTPSGHEMDDLSLLILEVNPGKG